MKKVLKLGVGLATLGVIGSLVAAPIASADTAGCVTKSEYRSVKKGAAIGHVHGVFDTSGKRQSIATSGGYASQVRTYRACGSPYSSIAIAYSKNPGGKFRLAAKSAVWVG